jgi:hypothetical protein
MDIRPLSTWNSATNTVPGTNSTNNSPDSVVKSQRATSNMSSTREVKYEYPATLSTTAAWLTCCFVLSISLYFQLLYWSTRCQHERRWRSRFWTLTTTIQTKKSCQSKKPWRQGQLKTDVRHFPTRIRQRCIGYYDLLWHFPKAKIPFGREANWSQTSTGVTSYATRMSSILAILKLLLRFYWQRDDNEQKTTPTDTSTQAR